MAKKSEQAGVLKRKAVAPEAEPASKPRQTRTRSKDAEAPVEAAKAAAKPRPTAAKSAGKAKSPASRPRKASSKTARRTEEPEQRTAAIHEPVLNDPVPDKLVIDKLVIDRLLIDPIGDVCDGEGHRYLGDVPNEELQPEMAAYRADTADDAIEGTLESGPAQRLPSVPGEDRLPAEDADAGQNASQSPNIRTSDEIAAVRENDLPAMREIEAAEPAVESRPPAKLDRLQKILSQAGIASRRHAEEMITAGRVMVNGQVVTLLGAKADPARDHIRVDGKLISGAERHRYFMLNKPRGYVTTVSDPEGRPTVMQFFGKMSERLYPVGRLDYESEGLLLVTNDGELANQLTRAAAGVEKTYLVKVAGRLTEADLDQLRSGVRIERGAPGSDKVHTAPAEIHQVRQGDNPWYEVVLIEGRNRELRKMFQTVGHFVEKIRRVGYGPLVLDLEPGKLRELDAEEISALRLAAEGKWKRKRPAQTGPRQRTGKPDRAQTGPALPREGGRPFAPREAGNKMRDAGQRRAGGFGQRRPAPGARPGPALGARPGARTGAGSGARAGAGTGAGSRPERPFQRQQGGKPFRESSSWKPRQERPGAGARSQERGFGDRSQQRQRGPNFGDARRVGDKFAGNKFGEGHGERFREGQSARFNERRGENQSNRGGKTWNRPTNRTENRPPAGEGSEQRFRGPSNRERDRRPAPEGRERPALDRDERSTGRGPRGFTPGRFSKPDSRRSGFKGGPGGAKRGGPRPGGGRNRG